MKKKITLLLITFLISVYSISQNYYYYQGERVSLKILSKKILVKFKTEISLYEKKKAIEVNPAMESISKTNFITKNIVLADMRIKVNKNGLKEIMKQIKRNKNVVSAQICFINEKDSVIQGITDRFIVKLKSPSDYYDLQTLASKTNTTIIEQNQFDRSKYVLSADKTSKGNAIEMANFYFETAIFEYAEPEFFRILETNCVNDPNFPSQWALKNTGQHGGIAGADIDACSAWGISTGRGLILVAVIDVGVDLNHPDLVNNILSGYDATGNNSEGAPQGNDAHGTACAGIIAASGNNLQGVTGIAYSSKIIPVRIAYNDDNGNFITNDTWISDAINCSWQNGADILSNSWGGGSVSNQVTGAINNAINNGRNGLGCPVLFASGNNNGEVLYPANLDNVIAVGALSMCNERKNPNSCDGEDGWGSNYGNELDVSAPGVKIYTTDISGEAGYELGDYDADFNGTSSACPHAAGVMALILSVNRCLTQQEARSILELSCDKSGQYCYNPGKPNGLWNNQMGYGKINAFKAVQYAFSVETNPFFNLAGTDQGATADYKWILSNGGCSQLAAGTYVVKRHEITANVSYPYTQAPILHGSANGFSIANPNSGNYYMDIVSVSETSATVRTWVYEVKSTISGQSYSWVPVSPSNVKFNFTVLSTLEKNIFLQNQTVSNGVEAHNAMNKIEAGSNVTNNVPEGDYIIEGDANVTLHGGNKINLHPGTIFKPGSNGSIQIKSDPFFTCSQFPAGIKANKGRNFHYVIKNYKVTKLNDNANTEKESSNTKKLFQESSVKLKNYPNPFCKNTTIEYEIGNTEIVTISIYDNCGRLLYKLNNKSVHAAGTYKLKLEDFELKPGIYYCTLQTEKHIKTIELIKAK